MYDKDSIIIRLAWIAEKLVGGLFVVAAVLKAVDFEQFAVQVSYYGVVKQPVLVWYSAIGSVAVETLLGVTMIVSLRVRGLTFAAVMAMLAVFTGLIGYAWAFRDLQDCGCFGSYVPMGPAASIMKNIVLMAMVGFSWRGLHRGTPKHRVSFSIHVAKAAVSLACCAAVLVAGLVQLPEKKTSSDGTPANAAPCKFDYQFTDADGMVWDLTKGRHLVAIMSATCDHCKASVPALNELGADPDFPPVVGLMLAESKDELDLFALDTGVEFPLWTIDPVEWAFLIIDEPPRYFLIEDCQELASWNHELPSAGEVARALGGPAS